MADGIDPTVCLRQRIVGLEYRVEPVGPRDPSQRSRIALVPEQGRSNDSDAAGGQGFSQRAQVIGRPGEPVQEECGGAFAANLAEPEGLGLLPHANASCAARVASS